MTFWFMYYCIIQNEEYSWCNSFVDVIQLYVFNVDTEYHILSSYVDALNLKDSEQHSF